jgi:hypothetical protein
MIDIATIRGIISHPLYDPEYVDLAPEVEELCAEIERLRAGLLSLKGEESVTIPGSSWTATRITSYIALNDRIDKILGEDA